MADEAAKTDSGKTVVIAIDGSEQARNAFDCKLSSHINTCSSSECLDSTIVFVDNINVIVSNFKILNRIVLL